MHKKSKPKSGTPRARTKPEKHTSKTLLASSKISDQFLRQIITDVREGIIVYDREMRYRVWNPFMEDLTGLCAEKVLGRRPRDLQSIYRKENGKLRMEKKTLDNIEASIRRAMTGETFSYLDIPFVIKKTGLMGWTSVRYGPFHNAQGEIVGVLATVHETTERKRTEEKLRESERQLTEAQEVAHIGNWNWDIPNNVVTWSDELYRMYGLKPQEMPISYEILLSFIHPEDRQKVNDVVQKMMRDHKPFSQDRRILWRDGTVRVQHSRGRIELDSEGRPLRMYGTAQDITERKQAEERLGRNEEEVRKILTNIDEIVYRVDVQGDPMRGKCRFVSPRTEDILGYHPDEFIEDEGLWSRIFHPDDLEPVAESTRKILEDRSPGVREYRLRHKYSGEYRWMEDKVVPQVDESGTVVGFFGVARDITERKRVAMELEKSLSLLRATLESTADGILVVDREGKIVSCNQKFINLWKIPESIIQSQDNDQALAFVLAQLKDPGAFLKKVQDLYDRPDAESYDLLEFKDRRIIERYSQPHRIGDNSVGRVWSFRDVTERRWAEDALEKSEAKNRALLNALPDMMFRIDREGVFVDFIPAKGLEPFIPPREFLAKSVREVLPPDVAEPIMHYVHQALQTGETQVFEYPFLRKEGRLDFEARIVVSGADEVLAVVRDITERKTHAATLEYQALHDTLTDLPNRTLVLDRLNQAIHAAGRDSKPLALLLMDLDRFKDVNDALGHHHGDLLLKQVGPRVLGVLRDSDTIARLGGDEFAVLLPATDIDGATVTAQKILEALDRPFVVEGFFLEIGASIGIAMFPEHGEDVDRLMRRADVAMYSAKQSSSGYAAYISEHDRHSPRRLALMGELRHAIEREELVLFYQPKIDLKTRRTIGVEALIRWKHPQHGWVQPEDFITLAEHTGFIKQITLWVLGDALRQWKSWRQAGIEMPVAVNLSVRNLQDLRLPDQFVEVFRSVDGAPKGLELEITESAIMADPARAMEILKRLRAFDIRFSIDDFGAGYSSLGYLKKLPVDEVKVDKSFVMAMSTSPDDVVIVRSTIDLAHNLGLRVVAEGVQSQETLDRLTAMGCDAAQGFYLSPPIPAEELTHWLADSPWGLKKT